jgi:DNA-binding beta-propeller fold protein YncE
VKTNSAKRIAARMSLAVSLALGLFSGCASAPTADTRTVSRNYAFWPNPPAEPRVQFLTSYQRASDLKTEKASGFSELLYGKETSPADLPISKPYGVAVWDARIYVTDLRGAGIVVLDLKKKQTRVMGATGADAVKRAADVFIGPDGTKYVADMGANAVKVFDANEKFVKSYGSADLNPVAVAVRGNEMYVCDAKAQKVKVLDTASGLVLRTIGEPGGEDGQFVFPIDVAIDPQGNVIVADTMKARVQKFTPAGELLLAFGRPGNRPGDFVRPKHIGTGADGSIFVVDASFNNVQVFDEAGQVMGFFGGAGGHPGNMNLPAGLAIVEAGIESLASSVHPDFQVERLAVVTNQFGPNKVSVYAVGHVMPGRSVGGINASRIEIKEGDGEPNPVKPLEAPATRPAAP